MTWFIRKQIIYWNDDRYRHARNQLKKSKEKNMKQDCTHSYKMLSIFIKGSKNQMISKNKLTSWNIDVDIDMWPRNTSYRLACI